MTARSTAAAKRAWERNIANRLARYMAVTHLTHAEAAKVLGLSPQAVRSYRNDHKQAAYVPPPRNVTEDSLKLQSPSSGPKKRAYVVPGSLTTWLNGATVPRKVSLPCEPWLQQEKRP